MIDTLKLNLEDCEITDKAEIDVEPSTYSFGTEQEFCDYPLFFVESTGQLVTGKKAFYNCDKFNVTIKPKYKLETNEINKKKIYDLKNYGGVVCGKIQNIKVPSEKFNSGIYVQTSLPRYFNQTNYKAISVLEMKNVLKQLEKDLWKAGIKTNILKAYLSRVDTFTNVNTDENFSSYAIIFSLMKLARMERFEYAGTTFLYKNGEREICVYDKIFEIENKKKNKKVEGFKIPNNHLNVIRFETRRLKKRNIEAATGIVKVKDLLEDFNIFKQDHIKEIGNSIFKYEPKDLEALTAGNTYEEMINFKNTGNPNWFRELLLANGYENLLRKDNPKTINNNIDKIKCSNKMQRSRLKRMIEKARMKYEFMRLVCNSSSKTNLELYDELKTKFYKEAS